MRQYLYCIIFIFITNPSWAQTLTGKVMDRNGNPLPFSSIVIKGSAKGVTANGRGEYQLALKPGKHTLLCKYIGFETKEQMVQVLNQDLVLDFVLSEQQYDLLAVEVKSGGEDPAYAIIRKAINHREKHSKEISAFETEVYIKGQMQLRSFPKSFMGRKIQFEDGDTSKQKMIFLSETIANYSFQVPNRRKVEVVSTKVSGRSGSFGLSDPQIISFYENNISIGENLNPRGFISPIADGALNYYQYKFKGTYFENGKEMSRIQVIPKRNFEPLFSGYISIIENDWSIASIDLLILKAQQMQFLDSLRIQQVFVPIQNHWVIKNQILFPSGKFLGFDFFGSFVQVYDKYNLSPKFPKKYFDNTIIKYLDSSNKKTLTYWDSIRPLPLLKEESLDYQKKDSLEKLRQDPKYLDSLDAIRNKMGVKNLLLTGVNYVKRKRKENFQINSVLSALNYNTIEGGVIQFTPIFRKRFEGRKSVVIGSVLRYGMANQQFSPSFFTQYQFGKKYAQSLQFSFGNKPFQFNNNNPISDRVNTYATLFSEKNLQKIYQAKFLNLSLNAGLGNGLSVSGSIQFQDRRPLNNLLDMATWMNQANRSFTPNYPIGVIGENMIPNKAFIVSALINWRPGSKYIEMPEQTVNIGSQYPLIRAGLSIGLPHLFGSDVDYAKWKLGLNDALNLKLLGKLNYHLEVGGFFNNKKLFFPDYKHFLGNESSFRNRDLESFQLLPYYQYSNDQKTYFQAHFEHHLNGLLSNKIPGFKKLNWFFVMGLNAVKLGKDSPYMEWVLGLENILKVIRIDYVQGFGNQIGKPSGFRFAIPLIQ